MVFFLAITLFNQRVERGDFIYYTSKLSFAHDA